MKNLKEMKNLTGLDITKAKQSALLDITKDKDYIRNYVCIESIVLQSLKYKLEILPFNININK